jgi:protein-S-isoprenylcysteine O-methyltransferase Ste14
MLSMLLGGSVAVLGEGLRFWAAGHVEKGREVTKSGPYRWVGHPLYLGSVLIAAGVALAARSVPLATLAVFYVALTFGAAIRNEERELREAFGRDYADYRAGLAVDARRRFSLGRAVRNREYRAVIGLGAGLLLLALKIRLML